mmetsp:Transcript_12846/g.23260  ORF Transcript_12846/g.23260 Transcript_12846/m.23260 type:complete len:184 (+) Transcript_12846:83-634(+)|eukprot:CAMPEP_0202501894 /NCGR_PEP_ID=MMETSP1361-20130828/37500_1 /ASSEMBLY_ACC=CAM_ASM_000849 /TAXON_ID=210615 /ORGANISM="Staurosira complex sp., Strain CCMP2646" /LENGTH=183 /DNA_ID=CAMNT_0049134767 /DNA_START=15 /DNA_END=566 /DNA_ORIENTATION=+
MVNTYSNGFGSSWAVIRENGGIHNAYPDNNTTRRHRQHQFAAILLVLVLFLGSAAHLVVRISGKRHVRHRQDYYQHEQDMIVSSGQHHHETFADDSLVKDGDATIPLSHSRDGASENNMSPIPLDTDNHQALADLEDVATNYNTTVSLTNNLGTERNDTTKRVSPRDDSNSSIPVENQEHKAS